jgi:arabinofuranosyltransferase
MKPIWKAEEKCFLTAVLILFAVIVLKNAWVCDDAYISFRVVHNFVNGYGLTWNIAERVQVFTHPLWLLIHIITYAIAGHIYSTTLFISMVCVILAVGWLSFKISGTVWAAGIGVVMLTFSKAFVDYSTSGLENPLTFLLLALFLYVFMKRQLDFRSFFYLGLMASLATFNRMDTILLCLPPLAYAFWKIRSRKAAYILIMVFLPVIFWELFSLFYYGFPFPNTAYAKLNTGLGGTYYIRQGLAYMANSIGADPLSAFIIASAIVTAFIRRSTRTTMVVLGLILYLFYIVRIGGCFMSGRYIAAPVFISVILLVIMMESLSSKIMGAYAAIILLLGLTSPYSPIYYRAYGDPGEIPTNQNSMIFDERIYYHKTNGLVNYDTREDIWPSHPWAKTGREAREKGDSVIVRGTVGMTGFFAGPSVHILDEHALADALLARLPAHKNIEHRIGHFRRVFPRGYKESLESGENRIIEKNIAEYYEKLSVIIKGDLLNRVRLKEIVKFNMGKYDYLIEDYADERLVSIILSGINQPKEQGTMWMAPGNVVFDTMGLSVDLEAVRTSCRLEISHDNNDDIRLVFCLYGDQVAPVEVPSRSISEGGLIVSDVIVPPEVVENGYDQLLIYPVSGDGMYSIGHIRLFDDDCD